MSIPRNPWERIYHFGMNEYAESQSVYCAIEHISFASSTYVACRKPHGLVWGNKAVRHRYQYDVMGTLPRGIHLNTTTSDTGSQNERNLSLSCDISPGVFTNWRVFKPKESDKSIVASLIAEEVQQPTLRFHCPQLACTTL